LGSGLARKLLEGVTIVMFPARETFNPLTVLFTPDNIAVVGPVVVILVFGRRWVVAYSTPVAVADTVHTLVTYARQRQCEYNRRNYDGRDWDGVYH